MAASRSLNKAMLIGNLTRDPVIKETANGSKVCTFGIATNSKWRNAEGEVQEHTEFHNIVAWNKLAEICSQILATGMLVYVEGEIRTRIWDDESGVRHYRTEIKIDDMKILDSKGKKGAGNGQEDVDEVKEEAAEEVEGVVDDKKDDESAKEKDEKLEKEESPEDEKEIEKEAEDLF